jgi:AcrR family transcriptional regulator
MVIMVGSSEPVRRRRGAVLETAILDATLEELAENGYPQFTVDAVATRAGASKNSIYRRWPTRADLVLAAVRGRMISSETLPDTGELRGDLLATLRQAAEQFNGPVGEALRTVVFEAVTDDWLQDRGPGAATGLMRALAERAGERGELDPTKITERALEAGPALLRYHFLFRGTPIPDQVVVQIVDEVIIPLWSVQAPSGR